MKHLSLIFIILTSIFQNTAGLKGVDIENTVYFNKTEEVQTLLVSYQNETSQNESASFIGLPSDTISNHSIYFVEFEEYEELYQNLVQLRKVPFVNSQKNFSFQNFRALNKFSNNSLKNNHVFSPVSKQVLYQVFII